MTDQNKEDAEKKLKDIATFMVNNQREISSVLYESLQCGDPIKQIFGITDEQIDALYAVGYEFYNANKYQEASDIFNMVAMVDPLNKNAWQAFTTCLINLKKYQEALLMYPAYLLLDPYNVEIYYQMAVCLLHNKAREKAKQMLKIGIDTSKFESNKKYAFWIQKSKQLFEFLKEKFPHEDDNKPVDYEELSKQQKLTDENGNEISLQDLIQKTFIDKNPVEFESGKKMAEELMNQYAEETK